MIKSIVDIDINSAIKDFKGSYLERRSELLNNYLKECKEQLRDVYFIYSNNECAGYATLYKKSDHRTFLKNNIPEIKDINIISKHQRKGLATKLMNHIEKQAKNSGYDIIGIGVGMHKDYGNAQRLYVKLGYLPTGEGLFSENKEIDYNDTFVMNDDLVLYLTKKLK